MLTPAPIPHPPPCPASLEFSEPSTITSTPFSYLLSANLGSPLSSFDLHVGFSKSVLVSLSRHGEGAVYTRQRRPRRFRL